MFRRFLVNYIARHRHRANQWLHVVGVPLTFVGTPLMVINQRYWWGAGCFLGGYVLQFVGHAIEGNDAGEIIVIKKLLKKPYVEFGAESRRSSSTD